MPSARKTIKTGVLPCGVLVAALLVMAAPAPTSGFMFPARSGFAHPSFGHLGLPAFPIPTDRILHGNMDHGQFPHFPHFGHHEQAPAVPAQPEPAQQPEATNARASQMAPKQHQVTEPPMPTNWARNQRDKVEENDEAYALFVRPSRTMTGRVAEFDVRLTGHDGSGRATRIAVGELLRGGFRREYTIPDDVDASNIRARQANNGILTVIFPRVAASKPNQQLQAPAAGHHAAHHARRGARDTSAQRAAEEEASRDAQRQANERARVRAQQRAQAEAQARAKAEADAVRAAAAARPRANMKAQDEAPAAHAAGQHRRARMAHKEQEHARTPDNARTPRYRRMKSFHERAAEARAAARDQAAQEAMRMRHAREAARSTSGDPPRHTTVPSPVKQHAAPPALQDLVHDDFASGFDSDVELVEVEYEEALAKDADAAEGYYERGEFHEY